MFGFKDQPVVKLCRKVLSQERVGKMLGHYSREGNPATALNWVLLYTVHLGYERRLKDPETKNFFKKTNGDLYIAEYSTFLLGQYVWAYIHFAAYAKAMGKPDLECYKSVTDVLYKCTDELASTFSEWGYEDPNTIHKRVKSYMCKSNEAIEVLSLNLTSQFGRRGRELEYENARLDLVTQLQWMASGKATIETVFIEGLNGVREICVESGVCDDFDYDPVALEALFQSSGSNGQTS